MCFFTGIQRDGSFLTLSEVFCSLNLTAYDLSIDTLDMHAHYDTFHRFDRFNLKYNPCGQSRLREIFLKYNNLMKGRYLADITKEVFSDVEKSKYQLMEPRISIYGRSEAEWSNLGAWTYDNRVTSKHIRWMVQIPRLYGIYKKIGLVNNFQDMLDNIFLPLFNVTKNPASDLKLHWYLKSLIAFDCVDDESKAEPRQSETKLKPSEWNGPNNPPYSYWMYYIWVNLKALNQFRSSRGMNTFAFRPHAGEAGAVSHLGKKRKRERRKERLLIFWLFFFDFLSGFIPARVNAFFHFFTDIFIFFIFFSFFFFPFCFFFFLLIYISIYCLFFSISLCLI